MAFQPAALLQQDAQHASCNFMSNSSYSAMERGAWVSMWILQALCRTELFCMGFWMYPMGYWVRPSLNPTCLLLYGWLGFTFYTEITVQNNSSAVVPLLFLQRGSPVMLLNWSWISGCCYERVVFPQPIKDTVYMKSTFTFWKRKLKGNVLISNQAKSAKAQRKHTSW